MLLTRNQMRQQMNRLGVKLVSRLNINSSIYVNRLKTSNLQSQ